MVMNQPQKMCGWLFAIHHEMGQNNVLCFEDMGNIGACEKQASKQFS
jgi:hypothetical protein